MAEEILTHSATISLHCSENGDELRDLLRKVMVEHGWSSDSTINIEVLSAGLTNHCMCGIEGVM